MATCQVRISTSEHILIFLKRIIFQKKKPYAARADPFFPSLSLSSNFIPKFPQSDPGFLTDCTARGRGLPSRTERAGPSRARVSH